jgi:DNA polymerase III delta prime subunit
MKSTTNPTFITKYRPFYIRDFCLTDPFVSALRAFIELDQLNLLLVGDCNSGKTTLINAIIREYYGLSKEVAFPENNIMFINNLKEQGIQYFRNDMKTFCQSKSSIHGKKKLVLIDDIDNINEQSQQVFRNYIDKYKQNVHFISVCTNVQKVIESIQSRLHIIQIPRPTQEQFWEVMEKVIAKENITIDHESKKYLITASNHSIRTMMNYLEKIYIYNQPVSIGLCKRLCSNISHQHIELYIDCLKRADLNSAIAAIYEIYDFGYSVIDILDYLFTFIKLTALIDEEMKYQVIILLCKYITIFHNIHEDCVELALFTNEFYQLFISANSGITLVNNKNI